MEVDDPESTPASPEPEDFEQVQSPSQMEDEAMSEGGYSEPGPQSPKDAPMETEGDAEEQGSWRSSPESEFVDDQTPPGSPGGQASEDDQSSSSNGPSNSEQGSSDGESGGEDEAGSPRRRQSTEGPGEPALEPDVTQQTQERDTGHKVKGQDDEGDTDKDTATKGHCHDDTDKREPKKHAKHVAADNKDTIKGKSRKVSHVSNRSKTDVVDTREVILKSPVKEKTTALRNGETEDTEDALNMSKSSLHDDHGELDYDEEIHEESGEHLTKKMPGKDDLKDAVEKSKVSGSTGSTDTYVSS